MWRRDKDCYGLRVEIIGHQQTLAALKRARETDAFHHAYLFAGPDGVGKRRVAEWVAALVNCDEVGAPCGACRSCHRVLDPEATHPDVLILEPDGRQITIAQVRELIRTVPYPPIEATYRVVIIDPADAIGEAAANALLKTLEEPPSKTRFVLVSSRPDALLITIRSRCQRITFGRLTEEQVLGGLVDAGVANEDARAMATIAGLIERDVGLSAAVLAAALFTTHLLGLFGSHMIGSEPEA